MYVCLFFCPWDRLELLLDFHLDDRNQNAVPGRLQGSDGSLLWTGRVVHPKFWSCSLQESCHSHCLMVKVNLVNVWLDCAVEQFGKCSSTPETIFISYSFLVSVTEIFIEALLFSFSFTPFLSFYSFNI